VLAEMKIIKSDFKEGRIKFIKPVFGNAYMEVRNKKDVAKLSFSNDFKEIKLVDREVNKPVGSILFFTIILAIVGVIFSLLIPYIGIMFLLVWLVMFINQKRVSANVFFELNTGEQIKAVLNDSEWKMVKNYVS
jgi:hypothetical protein